MTNTFGDNYCYQIISSLNCLSFVDDNEGFGARRIHCLTCNNNLTTQIYNLGINPTTDTSSTNICLTFPVDPNCKTYVLDKPNMINSKLECTLCNSGYYLNVLTNTCILRLYTTNCDVFDQYAD